MMKLLLGKNKIMTLMMTCGLMIGLYGCGADASETDESVDDLIDSNEVTSNTETDIEDVEYYNQVERFINETLSFTKSTFDDINLSRVNEDNKSGLIKETNELIIFLQTFNPTPVTEADNVMHPNLMDAKYDMEQVAYHALHFIKTGDSTHRRLHKDYFDKFKVHISTMATVEEQYY